MGVAGLWDILRPAGQERSFAHLAVVDGFQKNPSNLRGLRVGVDASIWFFHAAHGKEGENPELRTLFFRCARLMQLPLLPLFVFDGPKRPNVKRGRRISGKNHWMVRGMCGIIEAFGFEWRMAPGEAEAELAFLNRIGVIDAIISDDVDTFLFGALMIIRNPSKTLSGNRSHPAKNSLGADSDSHVTIYTSALIASHSEVQLNPAGLILIALLRGGDYHSEGLPGCGPLIAFGLARCGFGDSLVEAVKNNIALNGHVDREGLNAFLAVWRDELRFELKTNSKGFLKTKRVSLANSLPDNFPDIDILLSYTNPATSESETKSGLSSHNSLEKVRLALYEEYRWLKEPDLGKIAAVCELHFEWGVKNIIVRRFRTVVWPGAVCRILRRGVLIVEQHKEKTSGAKLLATPRKNKDADGKEKIYGTPSKMITKFFSSIHLNSSQLSLVDEDSESDEDDEGEEGSINNKKLISKIHSKRTHVSTDNILEYRIEVNPGQLVTLTEGGVKGIRRLAENKMGWVEEGDEGGFDDEEDGVEHEDGDGDKKKKGKGRTNVPKPNEPLRIWMPACMVELVRPDLVKDFEEGVDKKARKKAEANERKEERARARETKLKEKEENQKNGKSAGKGRKKKISELDTNANEEEEESDVEDFSDVFGITKKKGGKGKSGAVKSRMPPKANAKPKAVQVSSLKMSIPEEEEEETEASVDEDAIDIRDGPAKLRTILNKKKKDKIAKSVPSKAAKTSMFTSSIEIQLDNYKSSVTTTTSRTSTEVNTGTLARTIAMDRFYLEESDDDVDLTVMASQTSTSSVISKSTNSSNSQGSSSSTKLNLPFSSQNSQPLEPPRPSPISSVLAKLDNLYLLSSSQSTSQPQSSQESIASTSRTSSQKTVVSSSPDISPASKGKHYEPFPMSFSDDDDPFQSHNNDAEQNGLTKIPSNIMTSTPTKVRRRSSRGSNNSDSDTSARKEGDVKKSPRKSREQTSPRFRRIKEHGGAGSEGMGARFEEEEEDDNGRLGLPSLNYKKSTSIDQPRSREPKATKPVLSTFTSKVSIAPKGTKTIQKSSSQLKAKFDDVIIDLCSDSDEEILSSAVPAPYLRASSQPLLIAQSGLKTKDKKKVLGSKNVDTSNVPEMIIDLT